MAAVLARGETILRNAAREPEVTDLAECLLVDGRQIDGLGTDTLRVQGVEKLGGARHRVLPDRIETGTYAVAAVITGGALELRGTALSLIKSVADALSAGGAEIEEIDGWPARDRGATARSPASMS